MDDAFPENLKIDGLSDGAFRLDVSAWCWVARNLTNGVVPVGRPQRLVPRFKPALVRELLDAGRWHPGLHDCPRCPKAQDGEYVVHDYLAYNPTADKVKADREAAAERMKSARRKRSTKRSDERSGARSTSERSASPSRPPHVVGGDGTSPDEAPSQATDGGDPALNVAMTRQLRESLKGVVLEFKREESA